ncbi:MAG: transglutaminaseTgpA domain-containing protein [Opitutales bacterium]
MESQSRKLSVYELFRLKWLVGTLMALVSVSSLLNLDSHNWVPAIVSLVAMGGCVLFPTIYSKAPPVLWKIFALSIIPLVSIDVLAKETVPALLNLNTWLILYRALNHTKRREEMQLALLCLFLLVMVGLLTYSVVFGLQLLVFSGLAVVFLSIGSIFETKAEGRGEAVLDEAVWDDHHGWIHLARVTRFRYLAIGSALFGSLIGIAGIAFMFIPRVNVENKVNLFSMKSSTTLTGFSESISLGDVTNIKNDKRVALRVDVSGESFVPETPYWRMLALDSYSKGSFSLSPELKDMLEAGLSSPYHAKRYWRERQFSETPSSIKRDRWTFFMEPGVSKFLPIMGSFKQMTYSKLNELSVGPRMHIFSLSETPSKMVSYQLEDVSFSTRIPSVSKEKFFDLSLKRSRKGSRDIEKIYPNTLLELPDDPRVLSYLDSVVEAITQGKPMSPLAFASRATEYLGEMHSYSMDVKLPSDTEIEDPVVRWMQTDLNGHCEFFASSLILLSRAAGHQARAIIGYKGGAWNAFENYYMVRNSDAHAWCEIYDGMGNWIRVDPTPGSRLPAIAERTIALGGSEVEAGSLAYVDSLRMLWYRRIVSFDKQAQKQAVTQLKEFFFAYVQVAGEWTTLAVMQVYSWIVAPWSVQKFFYTTFLLIIAFGILLFQRNLALNYRELFLASFRRGDPIRRKASKLLKRFQQTGVSDEPMDEGRASLVLELNRLRFGRKETWPNPRLVFKEARRIL